MCQRVSSIILRNSWSVSSSERFHFTICKITSKWNSSLINLIFESIHHFLFGVFWNYLFDIRIITGKLISYKLLWPIIQTPISQPLPRFLRKCQVNHGKILGLRPKHRIIMILKLYSSILPFHIIGHGNSIDISFKLIVNFIYHFLSFVDSYGSIFVIVTHAYRF